MKTDKLKTGLPFGQNFEIEGKPGIYEALAGGEIGRVDKPKFGLPSAEILPKMMSLEEWNGTYFHLCRPIRSFEPDYGNGFTYCFRKFHGIVEYNLKQYVIAGWQVPGDPPFVEAKPAP